MSLKDQLELDKEKEWVEGLPGRETIRAKIWR
jgi:hypothetical protein